ncbi:MAG: hypothetical protein V3V01_00950 [Acidimicrobiales bacterium]
MSRVTTRLKVLANQVRSGDIAGARSDVAHWMSSQTESVGFRRDYTKTYAAPPVPDVELTAVALDATLATRLFDSKGLKDRDKQFLDRRRTLWEEGFEGGYVAVDPQGEPAYLQFFIPHSQADKVRSYWGPLFPDFGPETLIVEGAWIPPGHRKKNVMGSGLHLVTELAKQRSPDVVRYGLCYPEAANKGAVLGTRSGGYDVVEKRTETWKFGRRSVSFEPAGEANFSVFDGKRSDS